MGKVNARSTYSKSRILNWFHPHQGNVTAGATLGCIGARKIQCARCSSRPIRPPRPSPRRLQHTLSGPRRVCQCQGSHQQGNWPVFHAEGGLGAIHSERRAATSPSRQLSNARPDQSQLRSLGFGLGRRTAGLGHRPKTYRNRRLWNPVSRRSFY